MRQAGRRLPEYQGIGKQSRAGDCLQFCFAPELGRRPFAGGRCSAREGKMGDRDRRFSDVGPLKRGEHHGILGISHTTRAVLPEVKLPFQPRIQLAVKDYKGVKEVGADYFNAGD
jgi:hypothetical protein